MLGMRRVFIHRFAGILSAYGLGLADIVEEFQVRHASSPCIVALSYSSDSLGLPCRNPVRKSIQRRRWLDI